MSSGTGHAGDVSPDQVLHRLKAAPDAVLVDVRTTAEWENVGVPELDAAGPQPVFLEWLTYPSMAQNAAFAPTLDAELKRRGATAETPVFFLCRSGARSAAAALAMTALGYRQSFNVAGGFEGSPGQGLPGWRNLGLPWKRP